MAIVNGNEQNAPGGSVVHTRSKFPLSYEFFDTHRFGEYHPHFWFDGVQGDEDVRLRSSHDVRSYTLKAPLLQDVQMKKDYFMVPMQAILPFNWEKYEPVPVNGDDVASDSGVGCGVVDFWSLVSQPFINLRADIITNAPNDGVLVTLRKLFYLLVYGEYFYSSGSLMNSLGARGSRNILFSDTTNGLEIRYDDWFDGLISVIASHVKNFRFTNASSVTCTCVLDGSQLLDGRTTTYVDIRTFLQLLRDADVIGFPNVSPTVDSVSTFRTDIVNYLNKWSVDYGVGNYNISRVLAYQIVCAHYYSNDHVDYIYSANLFRELIGNYVTNPNLGGVRYFSYNGISYQYDFCSAKYFTSMLTSLATKIVDPTDSDTLIIFSYLSAIFGFRRSLRFLDYFTGTRTQPLAVGDVNIDVTTSAGNTYVSAVDVTKGISRQRLFNAVNRVGAKWENYIELMSGRKPAPDFHNPFYLGHTSDVVFGSESEYTGNVTDSDPQNVTSVLRSNGGRYEFNLDFIDRSVIVIGLTYYDLPRVYGNAFERQTFIINRYDMFNKFMQFVGDQPVNSLELGNINPNSSGGYPISGTFAYQNRDMQYKQRFNQLAGGFGVKSTQLENWLYRADDVRLRSMVLNPDFIRSLNTEFDKFYISLTGYSLGTYFHFIVRNINDCSASRPMAANPSIL